MKFLKIHHIQFYLIILALFLALPALGKKNNARTPEFTVVIDAGHGGKDIGAVDNKAREKDINLGVALELKKLIDKKMRHTKAVMTRDDDTFITLQQRADIANKAKGDLFISIHTNSVDKSNKNRKNVAGSSVYVLGLHKDENNMKVARRENSVIEFESNYEQKYSGFDPSKDESYIIFEMAQKKNLSKSIRFAEETQKQLVKSGRGNRGVHQAGFWVLWATSMPSVLIELDFICNPNSASYMTSEKGRKELAESIFNAVETYHAGWLNSFKNTAYALPESGNMDLTENAVAADMGAPDKLVVASSKTSTTRVKDAPAVRTGQKNYASSKRRRRSESARHASSSRNVETNSIPLHSGNERIGKVVTLEKVSSDSSIQDDDDKASKDKKSKKKGKKNKKDKNKDKKSKRSSSSHNAKVEKFVKVYKIQVLASADLLKQNNSRFCGLKPISAYREKDLYKYYYGESQNLEEMENMLQEVKKKIPDAFIVSSMKSVDTAKK